MGIEKLVPVALALAILAASTGQLPKIIKAVRIAQLQVIEGGKGSKWPKAMLLR